MDNDQNNLGNRKEQLSPARRALLEKRLRGVTNDQQQQQTPTPSIGKAGSLPPLSFSQQRLWFLDQLEPESSVYNLYLALKIQGAIDHTVLQESLDEIVNRHSVLRTRFISRQGQAVQLVDANLRIPLTFIDLSQIAAQERDERFKQVAVEAIRTPYNLAEGPLVHFYLVQMGIQTHILLVCVHHIIFDGWSIHIFQKELAAIYPARLQQKQHLLNPLPFQYSDFADWQRTNLPSMTSPQIAYWEKQLEGSLPELQLPSDRQRPPIQTYRGGTFFFKLPANLTAEIKALSQQEGVTLFMVLLAAFKALLYRYTSQTDILVGFPIANRNLPELDNLIGFFVNTLVLRTDLSGNLTFHELLRRVRQTALDAYANQDVPFEQVVQAINPARTLSRQSIFQVMFAFQSEPAVDWSATGWTVEQLEIDIDTSMFDLTISMEDKETGLGGRIEYSADLFNAAAIQRIASHFQTILESIVANPQERICTLNILPAQERERILIEWTQTWSESDFPANRLFHQLIEDQAERTPDAIAVVYHSHAISYHELNRYANRLAYQLRNAGIGPEVLVAISATRSVELVVALLAVMKAGGGFLPLDPTYPRDRLAYMLSDSRAALLLTQHNLLASLPYEDLPVILLDDILKDTHEFAGRDDRNPNNLVTGDNLAYVIYTSGSTGQPKGAVNPHRGIPNMAEAYLRMMQKWPGSRVLQFSSLSFDASLIEILPCLLGGATIVMADREELLPGQPLAHTLHSQSITHVTLPPSILALLDDKDFPNLRVVASAGEACSQDTITRWSRGRRLINAYGPTECTVWSSGNVYINSQAQPTIGYPLSNIQIYILDEFLHPVPIGIPGELCIGGLGVGLGYLNRPSITAEKFIPNPFSRLPGERLYRTGDKARFLPDGQIEYLGRIDFQVKIHGLRIELGEIESQLSRQPGVAEVVVIVREDRPGDKRLVAYIIPAPGQTLSKHTLTAALRQQLPVYMVPSAFVFLDSFPHSPGGKVDRRGLPPPIELRPDVGVAYEMPGTEIERFIARVWQDALGVDRVGIHDNFFELGGHSLLTVEVHQKLQERFGQKISLIDIFQFPTIHTLAEHLETSGDANPTPAGGQERARRRMQAQDGLLRQRSQLRAGLKQRPDQKDTPDDE